MKRNKAAVVTTVSTVMLGAGWAAGIIGTSLDAQATATTVDSAATTTTSTTTDTGSSATSSDTSTSDTSTATPDATATDTTTATTAVSGTFDGALMSTREGDFQAEIVVESGTITAVNVLVDGDSRRESIQINESALPTLQERVLSAQTWDVDGISGASYTVDGFLASVKDAMTQAGLA